MTTCLFVGGPWDGRLIDVDTELKIYRAPVEVELTSASLELNCDVSLYERHLFVDEDRHEYFVYFPISVRRPMLMLINSYAERAIK